MGLVLVEDVWGGGAGRRMRFMEHEVEKEPVVSGRGRFYGKHFASMYEGSMIGAGAVVFAVWGYVIATGVPDWKGGLEVELNPKLLGFILGESVEEVAVAIEMLCAPDGESRSKEEGGRRLMRVGQFAYRVVNGAKYRAMRDEERRREANREAQQRKRRAVKGGVPLAGEVEYERLVKAGDEAGAARVLEGMERGVGHED